MGQKAVNCGIDSTQDLNDPTENDGANGGCVAMYLLPSVIGYKGRDRGHSSSHPAKTQCLYGGSFVLAAPTMCGS